MLCEAKSLWSWMDLIYPVQSFRIFYYGDIKIYYNGVLVASNEYAL